MKVRLTNVFRIFSYVKGGAVYGLMLREVSYERQLQWNPVAGGGGVTNRPITGIKVHDWSNLSNVLTGAN